MPGIRWKSKASVLPAPRSLPAEVREEAAAWVNPWPTKHFSVLHPVFTHFPGLLRVFLHHWVRKPTDGTVLFLEEPSLAGGQTQAAQMLEKPLRFREASPRAKAQAKSPCSTSSTVLLLWPDAQWMCLYTTSGHHLLTGKRVRNHPVDQISVRKA